MSELPWRPVSTLPERIAGLDESEYVLTFSARGGSCVAEYNFKHERWADMSGFFVDDVTHWLEITPPTGAEKDSQP